MELDWGEGNYESIGSQLEPVAERLIASLHLKPGTRVLDVGCGTGNAALAAARRGAKVVALDPASRLLSVARRRFEDAGLTAKWVEGDARDLSSLGKEYDVVLAVFSVIFSPEPSRVVNEMLRVVRPGGLICFTSWVPEGPIHESAKLLFGETVHAPSPWASEKGIRDLWEGSGRSVTVQRASVEFRSESPAAWFAEVEADHPAWRAVRRKRRDDWDHIRAASLELLQRGNEDRGAFLTTSTYLVTQVRVDPSS